MYVRSYHVLVLWKMGDTKQHPMTARKKEMKKA